MNIQVVLNSGAEIRFECEGIDMSDPSRYALFKNDIDPLAAGYLVAPRLIDVDWEQVAAIVRLD